MSKGSDKQETTQNPWAPIQPFIVGDPTTPGVLPYAAEAFQRGPYMGPQMFNSVQEQAMGERGNYRGLFQPERYRQATDFGLFGAMNPEANPYLPGFIDAATRPIMENLTEQVLPSIRHGATATGNTASSRAGIAEGLASRGALQAMGDITSRIGSQAYGQGLDQMARTMALAPQMEQLQQIPYQLLRQHGDEYQQLYHQRAMEPYRRLEWYRSMVNPYFTGGGSVSSPVSGGNPLMGALGGAATGAGLGSALGLAAWPFALGGGLIGAFS